MWARARARASAAFSSATAWATAWDLRVAGGGNGTVTGGGAAERWRSTVPSACAAAPARSFRSPSRSTSLLLGAAVVQRGVRRSGARSAAHAARAAQPPAGRRPHFISRFMSRSHASTSSGSCPLMTMAGLERLARASAAGATGGTCLGRWSTGGGPRGGAADAHRRVEAAVLRVVLAAHARALARRLTCPRPSWSRAPRSQAGPPRRVGARCRALGLGLGFGVGVGATAAVASKQAESADDLDVRAAPLFGPHEGTAPRLDGVTWATASCSQSRPTAAPSDAGA